ncbi:MAG: chloride channel protein [Methanotrichaceae archaeon]
MKAWLIRHGSENRWVVLDFLAIAVGMAGGLVAIIFRGLVEWIHSLFFDQVLSVLPEDERCLILLPVFGGLVVGLMVFRIAPETKGDGIPVMIELLHKKSGKIRKRTGLVLLFASAITIGSGGSAGRDSPISQISASFGSAVGQSLRLTVKDIQILTICSLVAGLSGTFNAPLGSAIFGMEVILRRFKTVDAIPILLSAVIGAAVASTFLGQNPAIFFSKTGLTHSELWLCFLLGLIFGVLSCLWVELLYCTEKLFEHLPLRDELKPGLGGVVAGVSGLYLLGYGVMGVGYEGVNHVLGMTWNTAELNDLHLILFLMALATAKAVATASTLGSGASGGSIGPTIYVGTMMGAVLGLAFGSIFSVAQGHAATYALLGAGALFAGSAGAPLTCIVMIPEMVTDYSLLPPMMISCAVSYGLAQFALKGSTMYTLKLKKKGVKLETSEAVLEGVLVRDAMRQNVTTVDPEMSVRDVRDLIRQYNCRGFPVVKNGEMVGIITFDDMRKVPEEEQNHIKVGDVAVRAVISVYPDENMKHVMDLLYENNVGRLPVVDRDHPKKLLGIVTRSDAIRIYEIAAAEKQKSDENLSKSAEDHF